MASSSSYVVLLLVLLAASATANLSPDGSPNFGICSSNISSLDFMALSEYTNININVDYLISCQ